MSAPVRFRAYGWADHRRRVQRAEAIVAARLEGFSQPTKADLRAELARAVRNTAEIPLGHEPFCSALDPATGADAAAGPDLSDRPVPAAALSSRDRR